jgi:putative sporulation protein YyaC
MINALLQDHNKIDIFCIGTPKIAGDAIGPLVGSMLSVHNFDKDVSIVGTLSEPVTYTKYNEFLNKLRDDAFVIVVDATLGPKVGTYTIVYKPTYPGAALSTGIKPVGDVSIKAYTGSTLGQVMCADEADVSRLAHDIATELMDLLSSNKNKDIYRDIYK